MATPCVEIIRPAASTDERCNGAMELQAAGRVDLAEPIYRSILEAQPTHPGANYGLGMLLVRATRSADGLPNLLAAVCADPEVGEYWLGYLEVLLLLGEWSAAASTLALARRHGLDGKPTDEFARRLESQTADALRGQEAAVMEAVTSRRFRDALPLAGVMTRNFPGYGTGWKIFAAMLWTTGAEQEAIAAMYTSVRLLPPDAESHSNLGKALTRLRRLEEAEHWLIEALKIDPNFAPAHAELGDNYQLQGRYAEAESSFRRAVAAYCGAGASHPSACAADIDAAHCGVLFMMNHNPAVDADTLFAEHCRVGARLESSVRDSRLRPRRDRDPDRSLKIGFVSADLRNHAIAHFIEPVLRAWRVTANLRVTIYHAYPTEDEVSRRLNTYVSRWHGVADLSNGQLAQRIQDDGIDILMDLSGHTSRHRLPVFAMTPAPLQASWLGYPATTGLSTMDYYLADRFFLPPGDFDRCFTEKLVYLPAVWPFQPGSSPPVNALPATQSGRLTFGSFNRLGKINQVTVELWAQLLNALPESRMLIAGVPLEAQHRRLIGWFERAGIARDRLALHPWADQETHLALHHQVDIGLECTPYTGCTTSNHALWMGVPLLTLVGMTPASRLCAANLGHLGLTEFIARSAEEFVDKGARWARNLPALAALRAGMRARWLAAPARRPDFVAAGMERALRHMWRRWCAGLPAESFEVDAANSPLDAPKSTADR